MYLDESNQNVEIKLLLGDEFTKDYTFFKEYENLAYHNKSKRIFEVYFVNGFVKLVHFSNCRIIQKMVDHAKNSPESAIFG